MPALMLSSYAELDAGAGCLGATHKHWLVRGNPSRGVGTGLVPDTCVLLMCSARVLFFMQLLVDGKVKRPTP